MTKKWTYHFIFFLFLQFFFLDIARSQSCDLIFQDHTSSLVKKELQILQKLNSSLVTRYYSSSQHPDLLSLYLLLKSEAWLYLPQGLVPWKNTPELPQSVIRNIKENSPQVYELENLENKDFYLFYANALQGRYLKVLQLIRTQSIRAELENLNPEAREFLELVFDDLMSTDLGRPETPPDRAQEAFNEYVQTDFPWEVFQSLALRFFDQSDELSPQEWLKLQPEQEVLNEQQMRLFERNINQERDRRRYCCLTNPGCMFCPNNRHFLRD